MINFSFDFQFFNLYVSYSYWNRRKPLIAKNTVFQDYDGSFHTSYGFRVLGLYFAWNTVRAAKLDKAKVLAAVPAATERAFSKRAVE